MPEPEVPAATPVEQATTLLELSREITLTEAHARMRLHLAPDPDPGGEHPSVSLADLKAHYETSIAGLLAQIEDMQEQKLFGLIMAALIRAEALLDDLARLRAGSPR